MKTWRNFAIFENFPCFANIDNLKKLKNFPVKFIPKTFNNIHSESPRQALSNHARKNEK